MDEARSLDPLNWVSHYAHALALFCARRFAEARARRDEALRRVEVDRVQEKVAQRRRRTQAQIEALQADLEADEIELKSLSDQEAALRVQAKTDEAAMAVSRAGSAS